MTDEQSKALEAAIAMLECSYNPYSGFAVGACLVMEDGTQIEGANVENAAYGPTICAERSAVVRADGYGRRMAGPARPAGCRARAAGRAWRGSGGARTGAGGTRRRSTRVKGLAVGIALAMPLHGAFAAHGIPAAQDHLAFLPARLLAILAHAPGHPGRAAFWPFAEFSPEWQAVRFAAQAGRPVRFIDLPAAIVLADQPADSDDEAEAADAETGEPIGADPLGWLSRAAGHDDPERWWEDVVEHRPGGDPLELFGAVGLGPQCIPISRSSRGGPLPPHKSSLGPVSAALTT